MSGARQTLLDLATRCEQASGPDWYIERDIGQAIGLPAYRAFPKFTASLDAALTLAPDGAGWVVGNDVCVAVVNGIRSHHAIPVLALCAAALRARAAEVADDR